MKRAHQLAHLLFPLLFALTSLAMSLRLQPFSGELLITHLVSSLMFYAAPHFLWACLGLALKPSLFVWHAGFVASSASLLLIGTWSVWGPRDPSGLPLQWLFYWPLAGILLVVILVGWFMAGRPHAST